MKRSQENDSDFEIRFYEGILKRKEDFVQALIALGDLYSKKGMIEKGFEIDKKLTRLRPEDPTILYNLACSYSLLKNVDRALSVMKLAIDCGYNDFPHLERDADLENLRSDQRFQDYLGRIKSNRTTRTS